MTATLPRAVSSAKRIDRVSRRSASPLLDKALFVWWCIYIYFSILPNGVNWEEAANATESGSLSQRLLLGGMVLMVMPHASAAFQRIRENCPIEMMLFGLYMLWAGASLAWSDVPTLTLRRYIALLLLCFSCIVLGFGYYARRTEGDRVFLRQVSMASMSAAVVSLVVTARNLTLSNLLTPEWRSSLTQRGPELIFVCSYGLSALAGLGLFRVTKLLSAAVLVSVPLLFKARSVTF